VRLEDGLKLDINALVRQGLVCLGSKTRVPIAWREPHCDEPETGFLTAELSFPLRGWMRIGLGSFEQWIELVTQPRHFGGRQWYFTCPKTDRRASILWKPPGAERFLSRYAWGRAVAYGSQFETPHDRTCSAARAIRYRLGGSEFVEFGGELPPKPKGMHWRTYKREIAQIETLEHRQFLSAAEFELPSLRDQFGQRISIEIQKFESLRMLEMGACADWKSVSNNCDMGQPISRPPLARARQIELVQASTGHESSQRCPKKGRSDG
jgi:hypothetical protein